jgi:hypothetical protein
VKWVSKGKPYNKRKYVEQNLVDYDPRLLEFKINGTLYLEGYWQSENYFKDIESLIRNDLQVVSPINTENKLLGEKIMNEDAVCLHVRMFNKTDVSGPHNLSKDYYHRAIKRLEVDYLPSHYYVFSENPEFAKRVLPSTLKKVIYVTHNDHSQAYADLRLMSLCKAFVTANSSFSWWGAWLSGSEHVVAPDIMLNSTGPYWGFKGLIPEYWTII